MKKSIKWYVIIFFVCVFIFSYCYHKVNLGVVRKYKEEEYSQNELIELDQFNIISEKIVKTELVPIENDGVKNIYTVNLKIKNISNEKQNIKAFYRDLCLINEAYNIKFDLSEEAILKSEEVFYIMDCNEEKNITITFTSKRAYDVDNFKLYIPKELYVNEINAEWQNNRMLEKYIKLDVEVNSL